MTAEQTSHVSTGERNYRSLSLWFGTIDDPLTPRPALSGDVTADVAIVGAGYTGLWTAFYLLQEDPSLDVVIVEKDIAGFGASGRNGGWCSALFAAGHSKIAKRYGRESAIALQKAMFDTVDEVGRSGIECDFLKGGTLTLVTAPTQLERVKGEVDEAGRWGFGPGDYKWLERDETLERIRVEGALGAVYTPHCARIHPGKLVRNLATAVEGLGGTIYEGTPATSVEPGRVTTTKGSVGARFVVRATEGYTAGFPKMRRRVVPLYSLMIATEPLTNDVWREIGWDRAETFHDGRHLLIYAQRTADGRIAIGGRGAPYHYGSKVDPSFERGSEVHTALERVLRELLPQVGNAAIAHKWGGPLGVPRDWFSSVGLDPGTGFAWAGGYVGDGVSTTNLAGRTLRDLILGQDTDITRLPWVNHRSRSWEPEPFRWIGVNGALKLMASADEKERKTGRPTKRGDVLKKMIGI